MSILSYKSCADILIVLWSYIPNETLDIFIKYGTVNNDIELTQSILCPSSIDYMFKMYYELLHDTNHYPLVFHWVDFYYYRTKAKNQAYIISKLQEKIHCIPKHLRRIKLM